MLLSSDLQNPLERWVAFFRRNVGGLRPCGSPTSPSLTFVSFPLAFMFCGREVSLSTGFSSKRWRSISCCKARCVQCLPGRRAPASKALVLAGSFCPIAAAAPAVRGANRSTTGLPAGRAMPRAGDGTQDSDRATERSVTFVWKGCVIKDWIFFFFQMKKQ